MDTDQNLQQVLEGRTIMQTHTAVMQRENLDFYICPASLTSVGRHAKLLNELPCEVPTLVRTVQGLALHRYMAAAYGVTIPEECAEEDHIRPVEQMLDRLLSIDSRPLSEPRPPKRRLVGVCRHFAVLLVAMMRAKGIPARARCGLGSYFNPGRFDDHWVCEYWSALEGRWALADPQFDELWRADLKIAHNILDVPRDSFLVAGEAWAQCRTGKGSHAGRLVWQQDLSESGTGE